MSEVAYSWRHIGSLFFALVLSLSLTIGPANAQNFVEYHPDTEFEEWVRKANPACMPKPFKISTDAYAYRLLVGAYRECAPSHYNSETGSFDKPNMTDEQAAKWTGLAIGSLANPAVATYASGELLSAGAKCVLRSFVDASDEATPETKKTVKAAIDGAGTLFDWYGFAKDIPELANPNRVKSIEAAVSVYISSIERIPEGDSALEFLENTWDAGIQGLREVYDGPRKTAWKAAQYHTEQCEFDKAREQLKLTRKETDDACIAYGEGYRQAEKNMVIFMSTNRRQVNLPFNSGDVAKKNYNMYLGQILDRKEKLTELIDFYAELNNYETGKDGPDKQARELWERQSYYTLYATNARDGIGTRHGCISAAKAIELVSPKSLSTQCRITFFQTKNDGTPNPEFLVSDLAEYSYQQRAERWAALEGIRTAHQQCDASTRDQKSAELRSLVTRKPMYRVIDGACHELSQPELLAQLDKLSKDLPDHCKMVSVPTTILGAPVGEAIKLLEATQLYISDITKVDPKQGQEPGIVIYSRPEPGSTVRVHSLVGLTVIGEFPEDQTPDGEMVEVPALVPATEDGAKAALLRAGLVGMTGWEVPADKIERVPGDLVSADPATGAMVEPGSTVTLTIIGPRPMVEVPSITGASTLAEAKTILTAAGLVPGDEFEGEQAPPEGALTAVFYATHPPIGSTQEMFSTVSMIRYGLNRVPEAVIGMLPEDAAGVLAVGGKFVAGTVINGKTVKEGEEAGLVQTTEPAVGTPVAKGTVVNLIVGTPHIESTPPPDEDDSANDTELPEPEVVAEPEPEPEDEAEPEVEGDDIGWIGRWRVTNIETGELLTVLNITAGSDGLNMKVFTIKEGTLKEFADLPMVMNTVGVLRVHPKLSRELDAVANNNDPGNGVIDEVMREGVGKVAEGLITYLRTLEISRNRTICTVQAEVPEKGRQSMDALCVRE